MAGVSLAHKLEYIMLFLCLIGGVCVCVSKYTFMHEDQL